ncbi:hypothetical protein ACPA9J_32655 [Pseudomonas aeruginosa]
MGYSFERRINDVWQFRQNPALPAQRPVVPDAYANQQYRCGQRRRHPIAHDDLGGRGHQSVRGR